MSSPNELEICAIRSQILQLVKAEALAILESKGKHDAAKYLYHQIRHKSLYDPMSITVTIIKMSASTKLSSAIIVDKAFINNLS